MLKRIRGWFGFKPLICFKITFCSYYMWESTYKWTIFNILCEVFGPWHWLFLYNICMINITPSCYKLDAIQHFEQSSRTFKKKLRLALQMVGELSTIFVRYGQSYGTSELILSGEKHFSEICVKFAKQRIDSRSPFCLYGTLTTSSLIS